MCRVLSITWTAITPPQIKGKFMTIAKEMQASHTVKSPAHMFDIVNDEKTLYEECEARSVDIEKDWCEGATLYLFEDDSALVWSECGLDAYDWANT